MPGLRYATPGPSGFHNPPKNVEDNAAPLRSALLQFVHLERKLLVHNLGDTALAQKIVIKALEDTLVSKDRLVSENLQRLIVWNRNA